MPSLNMRKRAFQNRVHVAQQAFLSGKVGSRAFDTCFEMYDGAYVVTALMRRAEADPLLMAEILAYFGETDPHGLAWSKTAAGFRNIRTHNLGNAAAVAQIEAEWVNVHIFIPQLLAQQDSAAQRFEIVREEGELRHSEAFYAPSLRAVCNAIKSWHSRTILGQPFLSLIAQVFVLTPDGERVPV